jgi:hypothetical protein
MHLVGYFHDYIKMHGFINVALFRKPVYFFYEIHFTMSVMLSTSADCQKSRMPTHATGTRHQHNDDRGHNQQLSLSLIPSFPSA